MRLAGHPSSPPAQSRPQPLPAQRPVPEKTRLEPRQPRPGPASPAPAEARAHVAALAWATVHGPWASPGSFLGAPGPRMLRTPLAVLRVPAPAALPAWIGSLWPQAPQRPVHPSPDLCPSPDACPVTHPARALAGLPSVRPVTSLWVPGAGASGGGWQRHGGLGTKGSGQGQALSRRRGLGRPCRAPLGLVLTPGRRGSVGAEGWQAGLSEASPHSSSPAPRPRVSRHQAAPDPEPRPCPAVLCSHRS